MHKRDKAQKNRRRRATKGLRKGGLYKMALAPLGLADGHWNRFTEQLEKEFWSGHFLVPEVLIDSSAQGSPQAVVIREELQGVFDTVLDEGPPPLTLGDWFRIYSSLSTCYIRIKSRRFNGKWKRLHKEAWDPIEVQGKRLLADCMHVMAEAFAQILAEHSRIHTELYGCTWEPGPPDDEQPGLKISLWRTPPQAVPVILNGQRRMVFRAGTSAVCRSGKQTTLWLSWPAALLGPSGAQDEYPVYVQQHAINRLHERIDVPDFEGFVHRQMYGSLRDPQLLPHRPGEYLVPFDFGPHRLGYFVAVALPDKVVVRTFLFLTMQGTPEARRLQQRLGLQRPDIEYNRLDRLSAFVDTDIPNDPQLVQLFEKCGCGGLVSFLPQEVRRACLSGHAERLKQYLGLPEVAAGTDGSGA